jgi:pyruvate carboxylase
MDADLEQLRAANAALNDSNNSNEEVFEVVEEEAGPRVAKTAHHIRANSSIMHLNKILGE